MTAVLPCLFGAGLMETICSEKNCLEYDREKDIIGEIRKTGRAGEGGKES